MVPDELAAWLAIRAATDWGALAPDVAPVRGARDGHRAFLDEVARTRDAERALRLHAALDRARAEAGLPLTVERLAAWQAVVLGLDAPPSLRATDAFARQGRARYGWGPATEATLRACLAEATGPDPLLARAARVYLDVLFFHPFADGNGRAATLALDSVLAGGGVLLDEVRPLFTVVRCGDDPRGPAALVRLLATLVEAARRRSGSVAP
jgi:hypothetical protein